MSQRIRCARRTTSAAASSPPARSSSRNEPRSSSSSCWRDVTVAGRLDELMAERRDDHRHRRTHARSGDLGDLAHTVAAEDGVDHPSVQLVDAGWLVWRHPASGRGSRGIAVGSLSRCRIPRPVHEPPGPMTLRAPM
jgi:hypothetical protein